MISIFILDDHPIICEALTDILSAQEDFRITGAASTLNDALEALEQDPPDVILLDLDLSDVNGINLIPVLQESYPGVRILIFTGSLEDENIARSIKAGAKGYVLKGTPTSEIVQAIRVIHSGGGYIEPQATAKLIASMSEETDPSQELSSREVEIVKLVAEGLPNKAIATKLGISVSTVKFHLASIFKKLEVDNRAQAVATAAQKGWL